MKPNTMPLDDLKMYVRVLMAAGIPIDGIDVVKNALDLFLLAFAIAEDEQVHRLNPRTRVGDGWMEDVVDVVNRLSPEEKKELRKRVGR
jgi:hypothetical protein